MNAIARPEEWDDQRYLFWRVLDHGRWTSISRSDALRTKAGRLRAGARDARFRYCHDHHDWELSMTNITGAEALAWATKRHV